MIGTTQHTYYTALNTGYINNFMDGWFSWFYIGGIVWLAGLISSPST